MEKSKGQFYSNPNPKRNISKVYDSTGKEVPNAIYARSAQFPNGAESWKKFLHQNLDASVPINHNAPPGLYKVIVKFTV